MKDPSLSQRALEQAFSETLESLSGVSPHLRALSSLAVRMGDLFTDPAFEHAGFLKRCGFPAASTSLRRNKLQDDLLAAQREYGGPKRTATARAERVIGLLPGQSLAAWIGMAETGVTFQWNGQTPRERLSVIVTDDGRIVYALLFGQERQKGSVVFSGQEIPAEILPLLSKFFPKP